MEMQPNSVVLPIKVNVINLNESQGTNQHPGYKYLVTITRGDDPLNPDEYLCKDEMELSETIKWLVKTNDWNDLIIPPHDVLSLWDPSFQDEDGMLD